MFYNIYRVFNYKIYRVFNYNIYRVFNYNIYRVFNYKIYRGCQVQCDRMFNSSIIIPPPTDRTRRVARNL